MMNLSRLKEHFYKKGKVKRTRKLREVSNFDFNITLYTYRLNRCVNRYK